MDEQTLQAVKALVDPVRLRILGLAGVRPLMVATAARELRLPVPTVHRQIGQLVRVGLLQVRTDAGEDVFTLNAERLGELGKALHALEADTAGDAPAPPGAEDWAVEDRKVLGAFFRGGRLSAIPAQEKKRVVILRYLAASVFERGRTYPEKEVNQLLALRHPDVAALRRYLCDHGFMEREAGIYRLRDEVRAPPAGTSTGPATAPALR